MSKRYLEMDLYRQIARYMQLKHPGTPFHFDLSGVHNPSRTTRGIYKSLNGSGFPDLFVARSSLVPGTTGVAHGLFLELKIEGTRLRKRDGSWASPHLAEQAAVLERLSELGYTAVFACGYDEAIAVIESYLFPLDNYRSRDWRSQPETATEVF